MSAQASVKLDYIAAGCNRIVGTLDWGEAGLIAYCAHNAILIYDPSTNEIIATLLGHTDTVTCIKWFSASDFGCDQPLNTNSTLALISGSGDGSIAIWLLNIKEINVEWTMAAKIPVHKNPLTSVNVQNAGKDGSLLLVSTGGDGDVVIFTGSASNPSELAKEDLWQEKQRISYGTKLQQCSALTFLSSENKENLLLALGGVDSKVRLLSQDTAINGDFKTVCELVGHQNWVRSLAFTHYNSRILLASASQDRYIRLWAITDENSQETGKLHSESTNLMKFAPRPRFLSHSGVAYSAVLEALLIGHEDWVHSVAWKPIKKEETPCLLSASMDRTMALWIPDKATGLWLSSESVGDAGVNHLGYFTGVWHPQGSAILTHGYTGALHLWNRTDYGESLIPHPAVGGHWGPIVDACWAVDGGCLITVSTDQTARLFTRLEHDNRKWCEIARPQVHGHDFACVAALGSPAKINLDAPEKFLKTPFLYVCGSEEKVLRVFEAPRTFAETLAIARGVPIPPELLIGPSTPAYGATLPALGLSNKAIYSAEDLDGGGGTSGATEAGVGEGSYEYSPDVAPSAAPMAMAGPPLEEHLAGSTLWPEIHKLYGHGNELYCVASHPSGRVLASACKAQAATTAGILLWDCDTWQSYGSLEAHNLTVTQLAFSPDGKFLASASRDRAIAVFSSSSSGDNEAPPKFEMSAYLNKAHGRIVWGLSWSPDSSLLGTASRDGTAKFWKVLENGSLDTGAAVSVKFADGVRSISFAPTELGGGDKKQCLAAVGLDNGEILVGSVTYSGDDGNDNTSIEWSEVWRSSIAQKHAAPVRRLCWRDAKDHSYELASVGEDHAVRIYTVDI